MTTQELLNEYVSQVSSHTSTNIIYHVDVDSDHLDFDYHSDHDSDEDEDDDD